MAALTRAGSCSGGHVEGRTALWGYRSGQSVDAGRATVGAEKAISARPSAGTADGEVAVDGSSSMATCWSLKLSWEATVRSYFSA